MALASSASFFTAAKSLVLAQPTVKPAIRAKAESLVTVLRDIFNSLKKQH
jgi:hypothetical protein